MSKEAMMNEIQLFENAIKASEEIRQRAVMSKEIYEKQLAETDEDLTKLGTTPAQAKADIEAIDANIESYLIKIKEMIPFDLLKEYKRI